MRQMKAIILMLVFAVSIINISFAQQSSCDYKVEVLLNNSEFEKESFSWRMRVTRIEGTPTNITGTAEIEDPSGQIIKKYKPWTNEPISKQKTSSVYTPNLKEGSYKITSTITVGCDDINEGNNIDAKTIKIKEASKETSTIINQNILVEEKSPNITKNETINIPLISKVPENKTSPNNQSAESMADDEGNDNVIQLRNTGTKESQNKLAADAVKETGIVYESSNEKAKNLILISLLVLSVFLNIILIWRR